MSEAALAGFTRLFSDDRLTRRAVGGDERAFAAIFSRYHQSLYRFCLAIVGNPEDAQDALQNTMMKVLRALPGEVRRIELKPWLYRIAHNESIDLLRRRRETRQLDVEQIAPGYGLAEDAEARERLRRLVADMRELPERQRGVLVMRELGGLDFGEIGAALGTSDAVARQTLYEARQSLRQMEQGREMSCADVTRAISDGDGRVTRRRDVRAHLRACADCRRFREAIEGRRRDFAAISPLPAVAAAGMLNGLLGGSHAAGAGASGGSLAATLGGGAAKGIGASAAAKGLATAAVVAAIGITAADRSGVVHLGLPGEKATTSGKASAPPSSSAGDHAAAAAHRARVHKGTSAHSGAAPASSSHSGTPANGQGRSSASAANRPTAHPHGRGHERRDPQAAGRGQETAASHSPPQRESKGKSSEHAVTPAKPAPPSHPSNPSAPSAPPAKEQPEAPPAAPERAPQAQPSAPLSPGEGVEVQGKKSL